MVENRTWDKRLLGAVTMRLGGLENMLAEGEFTVLGSMCFLNASELSLRFLL